MNFLKTFEISKFWNFVDKIVEAREMISLRKKTLSSYFKIDMNQKEGSNDCED